MDIGHYILLGLQVAFQPMNLSFCLIGSLLAHWWCPSGIGPWAPCHFTVTYHVSQVGAIIMLAGIYYGAQYGGSTTAILANIPGEASSVTTTLDGYQMARQGKAGIALGVSAIGSFIAGTLSIFGLIFLAYPLARAALKFDRPNTSRSCAWGL
jgi:putative tricarboxylic transport membrane protein